LRDLHGTYYPIGLNGAWWTSSERYPSSSLAWRRSAYSSDDDFDESSSDKNHGFSVRCMRDIDSEQVIETEVVEVTNPATGRTWMDRNLGASRAATSSADAQAYGDLYQWGRAADGHQLRTSGTSSTLSISDTPGHENFILATNMPIDWRSPQNDNLWQGTNGVNNPCPAGYRLPTADELDAERQSWSSNDAAGAFASPLKLPVPGYRYYSNGALYQPGSLCNYWSSTVNGTYSRSLIILSTDASIQSEFRADGYSIRCIKDSEPSKYMVNIQVFPEGSGVVTGSGEYEEGEAITITATANEGYQFVNWTGDTDYVVNTSVANTTVTIPAHDINLTANFEQVFVETEIVDVINPATGRTWMDRNLGSSRAATSSTDEQAYGHLFQWGRAADGHEKRNSGTTSSLSTSDTPGHGDFITLVTAHTTGAVLKMAAYGRG
jgi:uncharacterized protein (TIGR02145 family)/uncharacterized repeat protein (TIGR02543 family)